MFGGCAVIKLIMLWFTPLSNPAAEVLHSRGVLLQRSSDICLWIRQMHTYICSGTNLQYEAADKLLMALEWFNAWSCACPGGGVAEPCSGRHAGHCASRDDQGRQGLLREAQGAVAVRLPGTGASSISTHEADTSLG